MSEAIVGIDFHDAETFYLIPPNTSGRFGVGLQPPVERF